MIKVFLVMMCVCLPIKGVAMSMFSESEQEVILFSPIEGVITYEGRPAVGAKVARTVSWKDSKGETETTVTNEIGRFSFSPKKDSFKHNSVVQFVAHQQIFVVFEGKEYQIWGNGKLEKEEYAEFGGKPKNLRCELTQEPDRVDTKNGWVVTSCQWELED